MSLCVSRAMTRSWIARAFWITAASAACPAAGAAVRTLVRRTRVARDTRRVIEDSCKPESYRKTTGRTVTSAARGHDLEKRGRRPSNGYEAAVQDLGNDRDCAGIDGLQRIDAHCA